MQAIGLACFYLHFGSDLAIVGTVAALAIDKNFVA